MRASRRRNATKCQQRTSCPHALEMDSLEDNLSRLHWPLEKQNQKFGCLEHLPKADSLQGPALGWRKLTI